MGTPRFSGLRVSPEAWPLSTRSRTTGGGRDYFQSVTDHEPQIQQLDFNTKHYSVGWVGAFADAQHSSVLFYDVTSDDWWLLRGQPTGGVPKFSATKVGNTVGFGHAFTDGRPFWTGDFDGDGLDEVMFYYPGDGHWFLGNIASNQLTWTLVATTPFSSIGAGYRSWSGKFTQTHQSEILFALPDDYWMLFTMSGTQLVMHGVGNTSGFGSMTDGRPFWVGNFAGDGINEMLFYYPPDDNWWMGRFVPGTTENPACAPLRNDIANLHTSITELQAEQTVAVNNDDRSKLKVLAAEIATAQAQLKTKQTQMTQAGCAATAPSAFGELVWHLVGNTIGYGHGLTSDGRPFWVGRFTQRTQDEVLFYYAALGHWHRGILSGNTMQWELVGTTNTSLGLYLFSNKAGHAWAGDFDGDGLTELVYRVTDSPNFWMFDFSATAVTGTQVYTPPTHPATTKVPNVVGSSLMMAQATLSGRDAESECLLPGRQHHQPDCHLAGSGRRRDGAAGCARQPRVHWAVDRREEPGFLQLLGPPPAPVDVDRWRPDVERPGLRRRGGFIGHVYLPGQDGQFLEAGDRGFCGGGRDILRQTSRRMIRTSTQRAWYFGRRFRAIRVGRRSGRPSRRNPVPIGPMLFAAGQRVCAVHN